MKSNFDRRLLSMPIKPQFPTISQSSTPFNCFFTSYLLRRNFFTKIKQTENVLIKYQKAGMRSMKTKRKMRVADTTYRMKTHNALKKRVRIVKL